MIQNARARAIILLLAWTLAATAPAFSVTEVLNKRTVELQVVKGVRYIPLDVFQDTLDLEGDQTLTGSYRLFGSPGKTSDVVVEFQTGSNRLLVNDKESTLKSAPIQGTGGAVLLPFDEFATLFVPDEAPLHKEEASPASQVTLLDINSNRQASMTVIQFKLSARPDYRFQFDGDTATLQVVFQHTTKQFGSEEVELDSEEATKITLEPIPDKGLLVASIHLRQEVTYDSSFDEASGQLILRLKGPGAVEVVPSMTTDAPATDMQSFLTNRPVVLDAGHGGDDPGVTVNPGRSESKLALDLALRLKPLLEKGGFKVALTRNSEGGLSLADRLGAINSRRPGVVLSLHANTSFDPQAQGTQFYVLKSPANQDAQDPFAGKKGIYGPSPEEIALSHVLARKLMGSVSKGLKRRAELIEEELLLPARRVFAPSVSIEVAYCTSAGERALLEKKAFLDRWTYAVYSGLHQYYLEQWRAQGGKGAPVERLPDVPSVLPAPDKPAPPPAKIATGRTEAQVKSPESANALDASEDEEEEEESPQSAESAKPRKTNVLPRAAAVPPPPVRTRASLSTAPSVQEENEEDEVSKTIRQASSLSRTPVDRRLGPSGPPPQVRPSSSPANSESEEE